MTRIQTHSLIIQPSELESDVLGRSTMTQRIWKIMCVDGGYTKYLHHLNYIVCLILLCSVCGVWKRSLSARLFG